MVVTLPKPPQKIDEDRYIDSLRNFFKQIFRDIILENEKRDRIYITN